MIKNRTEEELREIVKKIRKKRKISQQQLAQMMNYSNASRISEFESGKTKNVHGFVTEFCKALNIDENEILLYDDNNVSQEIIIKSNSIYRYKVPSFKLSIIACSFIFVALVFQIISSIIIDEKLKMWNISISVFALVCGIIFLIIQWSSSENYIDKEVTDRNNITHLSENNGKHPLIMFILTQLVVVIALTIVLALSCVSYPDPLFIVFYAIIILLEVFNTFFGLNVFKHESTKPGFIVYIFEFIILLIYLFFIMVVSVGLQTYETNTISYLCLGFGEATLLSMILRLLDCNKFLKCRKISEKQKKKPKFSES